ncbi:hypothetical protein CDD83_3802 [Cordyceps sp. RAO-2017]|nr:hypothetical protein CDD83_3802 [Cordyceps sp. RAO-2017]
MAWGGRPGRGSSPAGGSRAADEDGLMGSGLPPIPRARWPRQRASPLPVGQARRKTGVREEFEHEAARSGRRTSRARSPPTGAVAAPPQHVRPAVVGASRLAADSSWRAAHRRRGRRWPIPVSAKPLLAASRPRGRQKILDWPGPAKAPVRPPT